MINENRASQTDCRTRRIRCHHSKSWMVRGAHLVETSRLVCGKWMPRAKTTCARSRGHRGKCATADSMAAASGRRPRKTERRWGVRNAPDPTDRSRWTRNYQRGRYNITQDQFEWLMRVQSSACAMCLRPFREGQRVCVDHDHACCSGKKRSCGKCVRGLLCIPCNVALGYIEARLGDAQAYLARPPGRLLSNVQKLVSCPVLSGQDTHCVGHGGLEPPTPALSGRCSNRTELMTPAGCHLGDLATLSHSRECFSPSRGG